MPRPYSQYFPSVEGTVVASTAMLLLYNIIIISLAGLGLPFILPIILCSEKRRVTFWRRLGFGRLPRPGTKKDTPFWIQALSVGEVLSALPLVKGIANNFPGRPIYFSVSTKSGFETAQRELKEYTDLIFFFPYDLIYSIRRRLREVRPALIIIIETDIWPNFMNAIKKNHLPAVLVNARLSNRSFFGYQRLSWLVRPMFSAFSMICVQSQLDLQRFHSLGVPERKLSVSGNIKFDQSVSALTDKMLGNLRTVFQIQPGQSVLLAGSTHPLEEAILMEGFKLIKKKIPDLLLIIAPRNPDRAQNISQIFVEAGFKAASLQKLKSSKEFERMDTIVVDRLGMLRSLYAVCDIAFVGGSLVNSGGHNPLEPAAYYKPVLFGPDMSDFSEISQLLLKAGGAETVTNAESLAEAVVRLLKEPSTARKMGQKGRKVFSVNKGAIEKTIEHIHSVSIA